MADSTGRALSAEHSASPELVSAVTDWFARAHQAPGQARHEWSDTGVALLPLGKRFDAVRMPDALVHAAVGSTEPDTIAARLGQSLRGPVIYDRTLGGTYYALTRPTERSRWRYQDIAPRLGVATHLGVPRLTRTEPPGTYWVVLPQFAGDLCELSAVEGLVTADSAALSGADQ
ncbi:hypothetical protein [Streptomyces formicae]|uniref:DNA primase/polymerase bifunctional N-terminal domain-containing protein n=1 Tax=Streptomyces formicae TaxID=1616117 RepID=A0A291QA91_9ACTN|nr:hypothetical protein [Streptomyces formicae]ATL28478.1 hypothetical protein KY5_3460c [Streptomyces formicae]